MELSQTLLDSIARHERFAQLDATNVLLQMNLGELYQQAGRPDDAIRCFERCVDLDAKNAVARSRLASVLISQHRFAEAEGLLRALLNDEPNDMALNHNLGLALYFQHRFEEARVYFAHAAKNGLDAPGNHAYLTRCYHHVGDMQNAIEAGTRWADAAPGVASKSYLALLHIDGGDVKTALRLGEEVLAEDRENIDANVAVGSASMESQETRRARECFEAALRHDPENGRAWLGMGLVHMYDQEPQKAIAALANAARIFPDSAGIAVTYGWSFVIALDAAGAEQAFLKALTVDRTFSEAHAGLAAALALQGKVDGAHASLELARRLNRHSIAADVADSFLKAARGQQQEAIDAFAAMLKKSPREDILPLLDQLRIYTKKKPLTAAKKTH